MKSVRLEFGNDLKNKIVERQKKSTLMELQDEIILRNMVTSSQSLRLLLSMLTLTVIETVGLAASCL